MNDNQLALVQPAELVRQSTDIAGLCREIVVSTAMEIQKRKYVRVEGWMAIATAHGCLASSRNVERVDGGYRAIGEIRRMSDGASLAVAEGFVGEDEATWFGGETTFWNKFTKRHETKVLPKRPDYAIRAMAQTRAISRACRSAFAHVVVLMDAGLSTTPAEEVPLGGFQDDAQGSPEKREEAREANARRVHSEQRHEKNLAAAGAVENPLLPPPRSDSGGQTPTPANAPAPSKQPPRQAQEISLANVFIHFGKNEGKALAQLTASQREWYFDTWLPKHENDDRASQQDRDLIDALKALAPLPKDRVKQPSKQDVKAEKLAQLRAQLAEGGVTEKRLVEYLRERDGAELNELSELTAAGLDKLIANLNVIVDAIDEEAAK